MRSRGSGRATSVPFALGLPDGVTACLFDLDGVLTRTANLHAAAWKQMFDQFLRRWSDRRGTPYRPFDRKEDYDRYVDGKPRLDGVRSFLGSRGIRLPEGRPHDGPARDTVAGLANGKNRIVVSMLRRQSVEVYPGSIRYLTAVRRGGRACAVVSSSEHCRAILKSAGLLDRFDTIVDGVVARRDHLEGKPAPDTYLAAAQRLRVPPAHAAIYEDALAGVEAGRRGRFAVVVGVDRVGQANALRRHGATLVVEDLGELLEAR